MFTPLVYFTFLSPFLAAGSTTSAASALVTTTAGVESSHNPNRPVGQLTRPTNLFTSGLRGAVNFSYRPQIDDDLIDNDDDFTSSIGSIGGLHFDHYGPYAYNSNRQGYLVYGGGMPRDISTFSIQTVTNEVTTIDSQTEGIKRSTESKLKTMDTSNEHGEDSTKDRLLESHMLQEHATKPLPLSIDHTDSKT